jgi:hypothetical protein
MTPLEFFIICLYAALDRLYEILLAYQNRDNVRPCRQKPLKESERVGDLSLELSRLYNKIWSATLELNSNARSKKKEKTEMEVSV